MLERAGPFANTYQWLASRNIISSGYETMSIVDWNIIYGVDCCQVMSGIYNVMLKLHDALLVSKAKLINVAVSLIASICKGHNACQLAELITINTLQIFSRRFSHQILLLTLVRDNG